MSDSHCHRHVGSRVCSLLLGFTHAVEETASETNEFLGHLIDLCHVLEQDVVSVHAQQCHHENSGLSSCTMLYIYIVHALLYYELSLAARAAPSQLCLQDKACSGYIYSYYDRILYRMGTAGGGGSEASPPTCNLYLYDIVYS